jgi:hypothetical protein
MFGEKPAMPVEILLFPAEAEACNRHSITNFSSGRHG